MSKRKPVKFCRKELYSQTNFFPDETLFCFQMLQAHQSREKAIKKCVAEVSTTVDKLREQKDKDSDNLSLNTSLRQEQYKVCLYISTCLRVYNQGYKSK